MCEHIWYITVHTRAVHGNHATSSAYVPYSKASTDDHRPVGMLLHFPMVVTVLLALENSTVSKTSLPLHLTPTNHPSRTWSTLLFTAFILTQHLMLHIFLTSHSSLTLLTAPPSLTLLTAPHSLTLLTHHTMLIPSLPHSLSTLTHLLLHTLTLGLISVQHIILWGNNLHTENRYEYSPHRAVHSGLPAHDT